MGSRRRSREIALQVLYQMDMTGADPQEAIAAYYNSFDAPVSVREFFEKLVLGVSLHREEIDRLIVAASQHWRLERMPVVDRNILRIAVYEMLHCGDIPPKVSINEAIDLGKTYGSEESGSFINGILDHVLPELHRDAARSSSPVPPPEL
ncbi:MAG: transcription antitermination factor NusB [Syntrophobacteraceae bacterium]